MAMAACYPSAYFPPQRHQIETYRPPQVYMKPRVPPQDYSIPLHVDCSVEYELPDCAKPPQGVKIEPLLMIHPCHFRNLERQRRRPFENNLPNKTSRCCEFGDCSGEFPGAAPPKYRALRSHPYAARPQELPYQPHHQPLHQPHHQPHRQPALVYDA